MKSLRLTLPFLLLILTPFVSCDRIIYYEMFLPVCTVVYDANSSTSGTVPSGPVTYNPGDIITVLDNTGTLARTGYTFTGWNTRPDGSGATYLTGSTFTMGSSTVVLYALWAGNPYTITFDANDGSGSTATQTINCGDTAALDANTFTRTDYAFQGWATTADGTVSYTDGASYTMGAVNITLYADWDCRYKIAFSTNRDVNREIYTMNPDGTNQTNITNYSTGINQAPDDDEPSWSYNGNYIVFTTYRGETYKEIYFMNKNGTGQTRITDNDQTDQNPHWSPDNDDYIVFDRMNNTWYDVYVMEADGNPETRITGSATDGIDRHPSWSDDGLRIVFYSDRADYYEIYIMDTDGNNVIKLTNNLFNDIDPEWSPDGSHILFVSDRNGNNEIYIMDPDGNNQTRLTSNTFDDIEPAWSPDGSQIVFVSNRDGNYEIYKMDADGNNQTRITNNSANDRNPAWSPALW